MACIATPTATLFGTTLVPTFGLSTAVITQVQTLDYLTVTIPCAPGEICAAVEITTRIISECWI